MEKLINMFNIYKHEQQEYEEKQEERRIDSEEKQRRSHLKTREKLSARYEERLNKEISCLNKEAPELPTQLAGKSMRRFLQSRGTNSEKERVRKAAERNSWLDTTPNEHCPFKLRPRMKTKEIQRPYSTRPKTQNKRLEAAVIYNRQLYDTSFSPDDPSANCYNSLSGLPKYRFQRGKVVHSYYHFKTHFKSIEHSTILGKCPEKSKLSRSILERYRLKVIPHN